MNELIIDETRFAEKEKWEGTCIYVRAKGNHGWDSVDISLLTKESLLDWLRSRGGNNPYAENTVGILLGWECIAK
jgi:hypothetical protein